MPTHTPTFSVPENTRRILHHDDFPWYGTPDETHDWRPVSELRDPVGWEDIVANYQQATGFDRPNPAAACALQHYAGRFAHTLLAIWSSTRIIVNPELEHWFAHIDNRGATHQVSCPDLPATHYGTIEDLAGALIAHLTPLVDAIRQHTPLTRRVAWGCIAAACAAVFRRIYRAADVAHHEPVFASASKVLNLLDAQADRTLIQLHQHADPVGLTYDRSTCCLIRLGHDKTACGTCPDIPAHERRERQHVALLAPADPWPLEWKATQ